MDLQWVCPLCDDCEGFSGPRDLASHLMSDHDEWLLTHQVPFAPTSW